MILVRLFVAAIIMCLMIDQMSRMAIRGIERKDLVLIGMILISEVYLLKG